MDGTGRAVRWLLLAHMRFGRGIPDRGIDRRSIREEDYHKNLLVLSVHDGAEGRVVTGLGRSGVMA